MAVITLTGSGTWALPADWNDAVNTIEIYGAGGRGANGTAAQSGGGGGAGSYLKATNVPLKASVDAGYVTSTAYVLAATTYCYLWQGNTGSGTGPLVTAYGGQNGSGINRGVGGSGALSFAIITSVN